MSCSGECCVCTFGGNNGGCLAGRNDDYFSPATKEQIINNLESGHFPRYYGYMVSHLKDKFGIDYERDKAAGVLELKLQVKELTDKVDKIEKAIKRLDPGFLKPSTAEGVCMTFSEIEKAIKGQNNV